MDEFFNQIAVAAENGLYYLALAGALMLPDICGALESPDGQTNGARYSAWFDQHVAPLYKRPGESEGVIMTGDTCWKFRCSLLHQGITQHPKSEYSRILFVEPNSANGNVFHMNVWGDALNIDVRKFCMEMANAAINWREKVSGTEPFESNVKKFVTRYPNGLPPYVVGAPVIS